MAKTGRPSKYTKKLTQKICERLALGESMRSICSKKDMPGRRTVLRWLAKHDEFRDLHAEARQLQADYHFDEILDIADDATNDFMVRERADGSTETVLNQEHMQRSRLRIEGRKWVLARMSPKKYGDKVQLEADGDGGTVAFVMNLHGGDGGE